MATDTKAKLLDAAFACLIDHGIAGTSTRVVGERAGVKHALIHYHFGNLEGLLAQTAREVSQRRAAVYGERLRDVASFGDLAVVARTLHADERALGTVAVLAQLLAGVPSHPGLAPVLRENFLLLSGVVRDAIQRLLEGTPLEGELHVDQLATSVSAGFLGLELLDVAGVVEDDPIAGLEDLARMVDLVTEAGGVTRAVIRRRLRR